MNTTPSEFWLNIQKLAEAYDAEGLTPEERATSITEDMLAMPPLVRRELLTRMRTLWLHLGDVYSIVSAAVNIAEEPVGKRHGGAA